MFLFAHVHPRFDQPGWRAIPTFKLIAGFYCQRSLVVLLLHCQPSSLVVFVISCASSVSTTWEREPPGRRVVFSSHLPSSTADHLHVAGKQFLAPAVILIGCPIQAGTCHRTIGGFSGRWQFWANNPTGVNSRWGHCERNQKRNQGRSKKKLFACCGTLLHGQYKSPCRYRHALETSMA